MGGLVGRFASSPAGLPILATLCLAVIAIVPVAIFKLPQNSQLITLGLFNNVTVSGWAYVGWWLLIPVVAFAIATLTRILPAAAPYRKVADQLALLALVAVLVWAFTGGSIGADIRQARNEMRGLMGSRVVEQFRFLILPYYGAILALVAPALLFAARLRERPRKDSGSLQAKTETAHTKSENAKDWLSPWGIAAIVLALVGILAIGFVIVGMVGFFLFGGVGPDWFRFFMMVFLVVAVAAAATFGLGYVLSARLNRPTGLKTVSKFLIGAGSVGAGIMIGLMTATDQRIGGATFIIAVVVALIPFAVIVMTFITKRRSRSAGQTGRETIAPKL